MFEFLSSGQQKRPTNVKYPSVDVDSNRNYIIFTLHTSSWEISALKLESCFILMFDSIHVVSVRGCIFHWFERAIHLLIEKQYPSILEHSDYYIACDSISPVRIRQAGNMINWKYINPKRQNQTSSTISYTYIERRLLRLLFSSVYEYTLTVERKEIIVLRIYWFMSAISSLSIPLSYLLFS